MEYSPEIADLGEEYYPPFGTSNSSYEGEVRPFYAFWGAYSTKKAFAWEDQYSTKGAPNRWVRRKIEQENEKARELGRKKYNNEVRHLVTRLREMDPRVKRYLREKEEERRAKQQQAEEAKRQRKAEKLADIERLRMEHTKLMKEYDSELSKLGDAGDFYSDDDESGDDGARGSGAHGEDCHDDEEEEEEPQMDGFFCAACNKVFKSDKSFANHEKSKKHIENVMILKAELEREEEEFQQMSSKTVSACGSADELDLDDEDVEDDDMEKVQYDSEGAEEEEGGEVEEEGEEEEGQEDVSNNDDDDVFAAGMTNFYTSSKKQQKKKMKKMNKLFQANFGAAQVDSEGEEENVNSRQAQSDGGNVEEEEGVEEKLRDLSLGTNSGKKAKKKAKKKAAVAFDIDDEEGNEDSDTTENVSDVKGKPQKYQDMLAGLAFGQKMRDDEDDDDWGTGKRGKGKGKGKKGRRWGGGGSNNSASVSKSSNVTDGVTELHEEENEMGIEVDATASEDKGTGKKKGKKGKNRKAGNSEVDLTDKDHVCQECKVEFPSRNKLFAHMKKTGHQKPL
eukprot:Nk52_evm13s2085 gene=Nk52_evmTU13s2085